MVIAFLYVEVLKLGKGGECGNSQVVLILPGEQLGTVTI
jgi:hypothetical protein